MRLHTTGKGGKNNGSGNISLRLGVSQRQGPPDGDVRIRRQRRPPPRALKFLSEAAEMVHFMFTEPTVPPADQLIPKKIDAAKTKEVLEAAMEFVHQCFILDHEGAEELAKSKAEALGIKLGDFMMPIRMAVTGSRVSPPLIGSIVVLGEEKSLARIEKTIATL